MKDTCPYKVASCTPDSPCPYCDDHRLGAFDFDYPDDYDDFDDEDFDDWDEDEWQDFDEDDDVV